MKHIDKKPHNFERVYLNHESGHDDQMVYGMRLDIFMDELVLNYTYINPDYAENTYPHQLKSINISSGAEKILEDTKLQDDSGYGDMFHVVRSLNDSDSYIVSRVSARDNLIMYSESFKAEVSLADHAMKFIDSDSGSDVTAFILRKGFMSNLSLIEGSLLDTKDELIIMKKDAAKAEDFYQICRTTKHTEMVSVSCGEKYIYLLELHNFDRGVEMDDRYSIYTIDKDSGKRIGRADLALYNGKQNQVLDADSNMALEYFSDNLSAEYGTSYYNEGIYQPNDYHDKGKLVSVGSRTSCNSAMPCSQFTSGVDIESILEKEELYIDVLGIDSIGGTKLAISYITYGGGYADECDKTDLKLGDPYYNIDIMDISFSSEEAARDSLDLNKFHEHYSHECDLERKWEIDYPMSFSGKLVTCTDQYIAVPLVLKPIDFERTVHFKSVIALYNKQTHEYVSYIRLGRDYHLNDTSEINHPRPPVDCGNNNVDTIKTKMNVFILDIDSDCSQIAVSYIMKYPSGKPNDDSNAKDIIKDNNEEGNNEEGNNKSEFVIYTEVFKDNKHTKSCHEDEILYCEKSSLRSWHVGIEKKDLDVPT